MKKIISILLVAIGLLLTVAPAQAQLKLGVKGGLNLTKADFDDVKSKNYTGFFIGPMAEFTIPLIGLGVDGALLYANNGMKIEDADGDGYQTIKNHAIEIPINLKYTLGLGSLAAVYAAAGPQFAFSLSSDKYKLLDYSSKPFKKSELSLNLGVGVKLINHLQAGITYNIPLGDTAEFEFDDVIGNSEKAYSSKNKTWKISVAYMF